MNWLYDHLRCVPRHSQLVVTDELENREEFPELEAIAVNKNSLSRSLWRRLLGPLIRRKSVPSSSVHRSPFACSRSR